MFSIRLLALVGILGRSVSSLEIPSLEIPFSDVASPFSVSTSDFHDAILQTRLKTIFTLHPSMFLISSQFGEGFSMDLMEREAVEVEGKCGILDSCILRCGDELLGPPYVCSCDPDCTLFGDCCFDTFKYCPKVLVDETKTGNFVCKADPSNPLPYYGSWHENDTSSDRLCTFQTPPWCEAENQKGIPLSMSILLNFGPPGWNNNLLYSSDYYQEYPCPNTWEIWDPFSDVCRPVQCGLSFDDDKKCISEPPSDELFLYETTYVNVTIFGMVLSISPEWLLLKLIQKRFLSSLASKVGVVESRFSDLSVASIKMDNETESNAESYNRKPGLVVSDDGLPLQINFTVWRNNLSDSGVVELEMEEIISLLSEAVSKESILKLVDSESIFIRFSGIKRWLNREEHFFFEKWCRGGELEYYWNDEFDVVFFYINQTEFTNETVEMRVHVIPTDTWYPEGEYISNILYQSIDMNATQSNVSGVVVVCENQPFIEDQNCMRIGLNRSEFISKSDDGILLYTGQIQGIKRILNITDYYYDDDGSVVVCVNVDEARPFGQKPPTTTLQYIAAWLSFVLMLISLIALLITILVYVSLSELRNVPGWCLVNFCFAEFVFFALFIFGLNVTSKDGNINSLCFAIAVILHYSAISIFVWSTIISFDLYKTFTNFQIVAISKHNNLRRYLLFGYSVPATIVFICGMLQNSNFDPEYGNGICWFGNTMAALYFFAVPIAVCVLVNLILFVFIIRTIRQTSAHGSEVGLKERCRFKVFMRMSSIMCFAWIFGFLTVGFQWNSTASVILEFLFIVANALQGVYIFAAFVANSRVMNTLLKKMKETFFQKQPPNTNLPSDFEPSSLKINRRNRRRSAAHTVGRSVSNETCISNISHT